jgi:sodium/potassium/calcium exchanger 6
MVENLVITFDTLFNAQRLKILFKNSKDGDSLSDRFFTVIDWPLNILRNFTIPAGSMDNWDRLKMAFVPIFIPLAFCVLMGFIHDFQKDFNTISICLILMVPGAIIGGLILFKTKKT